jgi:hypothetical protein
MMSIYSTIAWTLIALILTPFVIGISLKTPKLIPLAMLAVLVLFSSSTWGQLNVEHTIYSRGTGLFYFSLLNILLFAAGVGLLLQRFANPRQLQIAPPLTLYFLGFACLLLAHTLMAAWLGLALTEALAYNGILNVLNMLIFMFLLMWAFKTEDAQRKLILAIMVLAALRGLFGLVRFIWFDGDSANPYRNFERLDIKLFFFDIADNFIASLAAFWAAWQLMMPQGRLKLFQRLGLLALMLLELAAVALSYRRASLLGLALMTVFLLLRLPPARRTIALMFCGALLLATTALFFQHRLQFSGEGNANLFTALVYDIAGGGAGAPDSRFYELWAASQSLEGNWLFGLGTWGSFVGDQDILSYHFGRFDFVHSGLGHIILKTGLVGLVLFSGMLFASAGHYFKRCQKLRGDARLLSDCGFAGFLFWIPTLLIGTPIIEFRTMLLIGLTLALPFMATNVQRFKPRFHVYP